MLSAVARIRAHQAMAAFRKAPRRARIPRQHSPTAIEADYAKQLVVIVDVLRPTIDRVIAELPALLARNDAERVDDTPLRHIRTLFAGARVALERMLRPSILDNLARRYAHAASAFQRSQLGRQIRAAIGIDITLGDQSVPAMIDVFAHENVALITKLGHAALSDVETTVARAFSAGHRAESVAADIAKRIGVHERHARLIARDQIGKLTGAVNDARQRELGIDQWRWRTVRDQRVRASHRALERQSEEKPFGPGNPALEDGSPVIPGRPVFCRCYREPVFDSLLAAVGV
jgi:hypothetical protein